MKTIDARWASLVGMASLFAVSAAPATANAGFDDCGFYNGSLSTEDSIIANTTSADGNPQFRIMRNNQDVYNAFYGGPRASQMFAVPCNEFDVSNPGTYWVAFSKNKNYLRLPPYEPDANIQGCTAAGRQPGIKRGNTCIGLNNGAWGGFERRLQADGGDEIVIQAHYAEYDRNGVPRDTIDVVGLTSVEAVDDFANEFKDGTNQTTRLDDIDVWVDDVVSHSTHQIAHIAKGTSYDFSGISYQRYMQVRFVGTHHGPIALSNLVVDMVWLED